jgi:glycosyltransferase involved in cell wall biosynthesis
MTESGATVRILLATYNGEKYLREQIDSILAQDVRGWELILSDDGSKDGTPDLLEEYAKKYPEQIVHYRSGKRFGCAQGHFMHLLAEFGSADYILFSDQDDRWHSDKVRKTLAKMQEIEAGETSVPVMVHTDLCVVNAELEEIAPSFLQFSGLSGDRLGLRQLLMQNVVTGCTMMLNRSLAELACRNVPEAGMRMHDWWIAILAAACGKTGFLPEATIDYRQHGNNVVGAKNVRSLGYLLEKLRGNEFREAIFACVRQGKELLACTGEHLPDEAAGVLEEFCKLDSQGKLGRLAIYFRNGFWKSGIARRIAQIIWG